MNLIEAATNAFVWFPMWLPMVVAGAGYTWAGYWPSKQPRSYPPYTY